MFFSSNHDKNLLFPPNYLKNNENNENELIYQLKQEKFRRELCKENYEDMYLKFEQLQKDLNNLIISKNNLEKEKNSLIEERYNKIKEWQDKNDNLTKEINGKAEINQNMYLRNLGVFVLFFQIL